MNKEKEIERMASIIHNKSMSLSSYDIRETTPAHIYATVLYNAGYGNVKEYQDEIDRLETELAHREQDLVHADEAVSYREAAVKLEEDKIKKQAVKEFAEKLKGKLWNYYNSDIDDLITELYGADDK